MGEGWRHNDVAKRLLEVALCASGRLGIVAYPGKPPTVIDEVFGHFIATVNPLVSIDDGGGDASRGGCGCLAFYDHDSRPYANRQMVCV